MASDGSNVDRIAGVVANAVRNFLTPNSGNQEQPGSMEQAGSREQTGNTVFGQVVAANKSIQKRSFPPPSAIKRRRSSKSAAAVKVSRYVRDILCLPKSWVTKDDRIAIPRGERRSLLAESGLIGKIEFHSEMTDKEVRLEICRAFSKQMGLTSTALDGGEIFPFKYLQRTGAGSRTLCVPSVCETFQWSGRQVSTLAKSGGIIYILSQSSLMFELYDEELENYSCSSSDNEDLPNVNVLNNQLENQEVGSYDDEGTSLSPPVEQQTSSPIQGTSSSIQGSNSSSPRDNSSSYFSLSRQGSSSSYSEEIRSPYFPQGANLPDFTRVHQRTSSPSSVLAHQGTSSPSFTPTYQGNQRSSSPSSVLVRQGTSSLSSTPTLQGNHQGTSSPSSVLAHQGTGSLSSTPTLQGNHQGASSPSFAPTLQGTISESPIFPTPRSPGSQEANSLSLPSCSSTREETPYTVDSLLSLFSEKFTAKQISTVFRSSGGNFDESVTCLGDGASLDAIMRMINKRYAGYPVVKVHVDGDDIWSDILSFYKCTSSPSKKRLRVCLDGVPSIDTGGVRRHVYTTAYAEFIQNKHIHLFDGPENHLRPYYSAESRGSGIFKALGLMVGHSICQDAIGFNFFSPLSYWYIACGEEVALQYSSLDDIGEDSAAIISKLLCAKTESDIADLLSSDSVYDILQRADINIKITMETKDVVAQHIFTHDALYRRSVLLDQFTQGLKEMGLLPLLQHFPQEMSRLFTFSGNLDAEEVIEAIYVDNAENLDAEDSFVYSLFQRYIQRLTCSELKSLVIFITGSYIIKKRSIKVEFASDEIGSVLARTCSKLIVFPRGIFKVDDGESLKVFTEVMSSVIDWNGLKFNTV